MKLVERFLAAFTRLLEIVTLSPYRHEVAPSFQLPLAIDHYKDVIALSPGPIFAPPGYNTSDDFQCNYTAMLGWTQCWTAGNHLDCWLTSPDGLTNLSTHTNYEDVTNTPIGVHRYYEYNVSAGAVDADGLTFPFGKLLNGSFPGPWIRACWGDTVHLKVNVDPDFYQGVSIHAHGLRQWTKMHMDGVPGITQCPIAPGSSFEYVWPTTQYGSSWYHSHYSLQYPDGLQGPLVRHNTSKISQWLLND